MKVSVIIPCFNRESVLSRALDSVLAQSWFGGGKLVDGQLADENVLDLIIVDDGSTDGTARLIAEHYPDAHFIRQNNKGVSAARNTGLAAATGDWVAFLDSDDEWLPHKLSKQFAQLESTGLQICHAEEIWVRNGVRVNQMNKHRKHGGWIFEYCLPLCVMSPSSVMMHRSVFDNVGLFDESLPACEDYDLWLRLAARYEVAFVSEPCIVKYGGHADQLSRQYWGMDRFRVIALENILNNSDLHQHLTTRMREAAQTTLTEKLTILLTGAHKHGNQELIGLCEEKLQKWSAHA